LSTLQVSHDANRTLIGIERSPIRHDIQWQQRHQSLVFEDRSLTLNFYINIRQVGMLLDAAFGCYQSQRCLLFLLSFIATASIAKRQNGQT